MSGVLRNTLRLVGTAKFATNNSTYLRSMMLTTNRLNHSLPLLQSNDRNDNGSEISHATRAKKIWTNFWGTIHATGKKISIFKEEIKTSNINDFEVSFSSSRAALFSQEIKKNCIFPSIFRTELNGRGLIIPKSNKTGEKKKTSFEIGHWNASFAGDSLVLHSKTKCQTFILEHSVYVEAHMSPPKIAKNGRVLHTPRKPDSNIVISPVKIRTKTLSDSFEKLVSPVDVSIASQKFLEFGDDLPEILNKEGDNELTDGPNSFGRIKLQLPMAALVENQQLIKLENSDDTFTVHHKVSIQIYDDEVPEHLKDFFSSVLKNNTSIDKASILRIKLESGDLLIQPMHFSNRSIIMKLEVYIEVDLDSAVPTLLFCPYLKRTLGDDIK